MYEDFLTESKIRKIHTFWGGIWKSGKSTRVGNLIPPIDIVQGVFFDRSPLNLAKSQSLYEHELDICLILHIKGLGLV